MLIPWVPSFVHDGDLGEWADRPVDQTLPKRPDGVRAHVWVGQVGEGLVVAAEVTAPGRQMPLPALRVDLTDRVPPSMPPIGWGHQFGFEELADEKACRALSGGRTGDVAACQAWFRREEAAREHFLAPLFERRWHVDVERPTTVHEIGALPAFDLLPPLWRERWAPLRPVSEALVRSGHRLAEEGSEATVELLVPWPAFPPVRPLELAEIRLRVAWADATDQTSSGTDAAPPSAELRAPAMNAGLAWQVRGLERPLSHWIGPCGYGLASTVVAIGPNRSPRLLSDAAALYMVPDRSGVLRSLLLLDNEARGYQYGPDSEVVSPAAYEIEYPAQQLDEASWLCGPVLAYRRDDLVSPVVDSTRQPGPRPPTDAPIVELRNVETRPDADGGLLVREGPRAWSTHYQSGQCGACPRISLRVWRVNIATAQIEMLFSHYAIAEPSRSHVEIEMSDDWRTITVYQSRTDWESDPPDTTWSAMRHCRPETGGVFELCEVREDVPEPAAGLHPYYGAEAETTR